MTTPIAALKVEKERIEAQMASPEWEDAPGTLCGAQMRWEAVVAKIYEAEHPGMTLDMNGHPVPLVTAN